MMMKFIGVSKQPNVFLSHYHFHGINRTMRSWTKHYVTNFVFSREKKIIYESQAFSLRVDGKLWHHRAHSFLIFFSLCLVAIVLHHSLHDSKRAKKKVPLLWIRKWKRNKSALEFSYGGTLMKSICCVQKKKLTFTVHEPSS